MHFSRPLVLLLSLLLSACATATHPLRSEAAREVPAERVMGSEFTQSTAERNVAVTFIRDKGYVGSRMGTVAMVDGDPIALLRKGEKVTAWLTPGEHIFAMGYAKHLESRPLAQQAFTVDMQGANTFGMHLALGQEPVFVDSRIAVVTGAVNQMRSGASFTLLPCPGQETTHAGECPSRVPVLSEGRICSIRCAGVGIDASATWYDLGNLEEYADPSSIAAIVDAAISDAKFKNWAMGNVGRHMNPSRRYIYSIKAGWIDLKHVISTASNPGAYVPGASWLMSWGVEVAQIFVAPMSAFLEEDMLSNRIGANAALKHGLRLGLGETRGAIVQRMIDKLSPLKEADALDHFGVQRWPADPPVLTPPLTLHQIASP